jgi:hypothetical protein
MKKTLTFFSFLFLIIYSCNSGPEEKTPVSENDIDAARNFIRAALDGDYQKGKQLLLADSINYQFYYEYEKSHTHLSEEEKENYKSASINVHAVTPVNDSTTIVIYSNSYKNNHDTLKLVKTAGQWLVDLKYLFTHDTDTLQQLMNKKDSISK